MYGWHTAAVYHPFFVRGTRRHKFLTRYRIPLHHTLRMTEILNFFQGHWRPILMVANYALVAFAGITILLDNRNPSKTYAYLLLLVFVPIAGLVVFYLFGRDLRKRKVVDQKPFLRNKHVKEWMAELKADFKKQEKEIAALLGDHMKTARMLIEQEEVRALPSLHNKATILTNGEHKYPEALRQMRKAEHHIHLEYYIFQDNEICREVQQILIEKAKAGVKVRFIYDGVGSRMGRAFKQELKDAGVELYPFLPVRLYKLADKANYRDHRKIIIIDGKVGFTGGINMDDRYNNKAENDLYWRDTHIMIEGDAVRNLQLYFLLHWHFVSKERLPHDASIFPEHDIKSQVPAQIIGCGPDNYFPAIEHVFLKALTSAKKSLFISTPYFIPTEGMFSAMQTVALSGVDVNLFIPAKADNPIVQSASCSYLEPLLRAGVKVYLYKKGFLHAKVMVVDELFCTVGTCNLDTRSFQINWEINAVIYDHQVNQRLRRDFAEDMKYCQQLSLQTWERRGKARRVVESVCRMVSPIL